MMLFRTLLAISVMLTPLARADTLRVVTSIAPVQGLVAEIMIGVGTPELLLSDPISPHDFAMRPSQAKAIGNADVLFYIGETLEPWLVNALRARTEDTIAIRLGDIPDLNRFDARELDEFNAHDEENAEEYDPHYWLDPENALKWLAAIAERLETVDPTNTAIYRANLERAKREIIAASDTTRAMLSAISGIRMIVTHDSIQYFERAFGLSAAGAFAASDGQKAGARSLNTLLNKIDPDTCIVEDITHPSRITDSLPEGVKHVTIDPMGYDQLGEGYYPRLLYTLAQALLACRD
jgi:zinc transport system substrate-binding protein